MEPPEAPRQAKRAWADPSGLAFGCLLAAAAVLAYLPCLTGGFLWDDDAHVTRPELRTLSGLWRIWTEAGATQQYYPVLHSAFWIEHRLWGDSVLGYHLVNVALHAASAWLLFSILRRLAFPAPRLAALVFLLHPVCVESVAWISEQKNTLSAVFYLASGSLYLRFDESRSRRPYSAALGLYFLALLTKTVTATLPAALLVVLWWRRGSLRWRRDALPIVPWLALGVSAGLFTAWMEAKFIGAEGAAFALSALERLMIAGRAIVFYASKLLWPRDLMFIYPRWLPQPSAGGWLCLAAVFAAAVVLLMVARRSRGPLAGLLYFAGTLFPALGFVNVYPFLFSFVADHFQYLASLGVLVPVSWLLWRLGTALLPAWAGAAAAAAVLALLGSLTWMQASEYRSTDALYRATLAKNPSAWLIHFNLAVTLGLAPEHLDEAIAEYEATVRLKPDHWKAHNNLASALLKVPGRRDEAISQYGEALRYNPRYAEARNNLGVALSDIPGRETDALAELREAIQLRPDYDAAHSNLGNLLSRNPADADEAISEYRAAVRIAPGVPDYHYELANALSRKEGGLNEAIAEYEEAIRLRPDYAAAHSNLGVALGRVDGRLADSVREFRLALGYDPGSEDVHANLANALSKQPGGSEEAIAEFRTALRIDPSDALAHYALALVLSRDRRRLAEARTEFEAAVRLNPSSPEAHFGLAISLVMTGGDRVEAMAQLQKALELRPGFELARRALEQLRSEAK